MPQTAQKHSNIHKHETKISLRSLSLSN